MSSLQRQRRFRPNGLVQVWRRWIAVPADQLLEVARLGSDKLDYLTCDREMPKSDVRMATDGQADDLLRRRLLVLGLDADELALSDPALLRHLQACCAVCESRAACAADLARASTNEAWQGRDDWRDYCENAPALEMLVALRSRSQAKPKPQFP